MRYFWNRILRQSQQTLSYASSSKPGFVAKTVAALGFGTALYLFPKPELLAADPIFSGSHGGGSGGSISRRERFNFIADTVKDIYPSLVFIEVQGSNRYDPRSGSNGSGFVISSDGLILTNAHVVLHPRSHLNVRLQDGRTFKGVVEAVDTDSDLATVRIPCKDCICLPLGNSSEVRPGEFVIALGSPLTLSNTVTTGVVSSVARQKSELGLVGRSVSEYIQTDAAITFGNSGGPLVNLDGEAIGINSMKVAPGISFAIPIDNAKKFLENASKRRKPMNRRRKFLGITIVGLTPHIIDELRARMEIDNSVINGILIFKLIRGSPADEAGLLPGDIIVQINGVPLSSTKEFYQILEDPDVSKLVMRIWRNKRMISLVAYPQQT
ncbi:serine protease HTRA2, mitochondrial [Lepeophtheirus salmonis]|uniref:serine protease HTRA2, mitochondrial n=1 Tax=Lepeophtheirus salmonis TaxID=72036 RepID=UPI001AEAFAFA|nr:serine protease HTRA2, mitochondrial-like [Lepeophtheirus salmonis]